MLGYVCLFVGLIAVYKAIDLVIISSRVLTSTIEHRSPKSSIRGAMPTVSTKHTCLPPFGIAAQKLKVNSLLDMVESLSLSSRAYMTT